MRWACNAKSGKKSKEHKSILDGGHWIYKGLRWEDLWPFQNLKEGHGGWSREEAKQLQMNLEN